MGAGIQELAGNATLLGGQGTVNVNSWAPDSERFAYVAYPPVASDPAAAA